VQHRRNRQLQRIPALLILFVPQAGAGVVHAQQRIAEVVDQLAMASGVVQAKQRIADQMSAFWRAR